MFHAFATYIQKKSAYHVVCGVHQGRGRGGDPEQRQRCHTMYKRCANQHNKKVAEI